jgi:hypothetical protein
MLMLVIIIFAFANLFFIIQLNTNDSPKYHYVVNYTDVDWVNAILAMYLLALGDFHYSGFSDGSDVEVTWIFFTLGTYLMLIVFLNVLIAIMSDTFARVSQLQEQSALQEQVSIMIDYLDLMDFKTEFKNMRYIIRVYPDADDDDDSQDVQKMFNEHAAHISKKSESHNQILVKRLETFEKNNRQMMKAQQMKILSIKKMMLD